MGAGKIFCIIGGIITLLGTFLFSLAGAAPFYLSYLGFLENLATWFSSGDVLIIIMTVLFLIFMISGVFILIGLKVRALAIIGGIFGIIVGIYFLLSLYGVLPFEASQFILLFFNDALVPGIIPLDVPLGDASLGTYFMLGGGVLGLIGGIMGTEDF
ncbi:MAG: hypothetical protein ACFFA0_01240 [Promethearchaeota archaeon]